MEAMEGSDMHRIVQSTVKAVTQQQWVTADTGQPDTVEFWVRLFTARMQRTSPASWGDAQVRCLQYITKAVYESSDFSCLLALRGHLSALVGLLGDESTPPLTRAAIRLGNVDVASGPDASTAEEEFHKWASSKLSLSQLQKLYNSSIYAAFRKYRFQSHLDVLRDGRSSGSGTLGPDQCLKALKDTVCCKGVFCETRCAAHMRFNSLDLEWCQKCSAGDVGIPGGFRCGQSKHAVCDGAVGERVFCIQAEFLVEVR